MQNFTKEFQFEANAGISGGRIDGKSQFLFCFVKWLNIDEILDDVPMLFYQICCTIVVKYFEILGDAGGSVQIQTSQSARLKVQRIARG